MNKLLFILLVLFFMVQSSCTSDYDIGRARVIERKFLDDSTNRITYVFRVNKKVYKDSLDLKNTLLNTDTLIVEYNVKKPFLHQVQMPKRDKL